ncbi:MULTISPECIES: hypothetical protein [Acetobacter]|uniref:hypothetical protein n=1 Tax=Acetobacter TaxID=434 RepID=UPI0012E08EA6|nr:MULTISPECIES: hypothetical protein [Acetobacter]MBC9009648.1 hypothetical protein [Acetobacter tropicalis]MCP1231834.1 hypothetical protein [Acetobacter indonesiensis]
MARKDLQFYGKCRRKIVAKLIFLSDIPLGMFFVSAGLAKAGPQSFLAETMSWLILPLSHTDGPGRIGCPYPSPLTYSSLHDLFLSIGKTDANETFGWLTHNVLVMRQDAQSRCDQPQGHKCLRLIPQQTAPLFVQKQTFMPRKPGLGRYRKGVVE